MEEHDTVFLKRQNRIFSIGAGSIWFFCFRLNTLASKICCCLLGLRGPKVLNCDIPLQGSKRINIIRETIILYALFLISSLRSDCMGIDLSRLNIGCLRQLVVLWQWSFE